MPQRRRIATAVAVVVALCWAAVLAAPASASTWRFQTLDGQGGDNGRIGNGVGNFNAATVWSNQPHVWYQDLTNGDLRHAWWTGSRWLFETLDGAGGANGRIDANVGLYNAVTVWNNEPHVWYHDITNGDLRHAWWNGQAWFFETLDGRGGANGRINADVGEHVAVTVWNNEPHVWYYDFNGGDLRHAWWNGRAWSFETLDGRGGANGRINSNLGFHNAVTVWKNEPHVWFQDGVTDDLRHAWWNGSTWIFETLDGNGGTNGRTTNEIGIDNAVTVWSNQPHVWYHDATAGDLRHAWWTGSTWRFEVLDGFCAITCDEGRTRNDVGRDVAVAVWNNRPHVLYNDATDGDLRYTVWTGRAWERATLDGNCPTTTCTDGRTGFNAGYQNAAVVWNRQLHTWGTGNGLLRQGFVR